MACSNGLGKIFSSTNLKSLLIFCGPRSCSPKRPLSGGPRHSLPLIEYSTSAEHAPKQVCGSVTAQRDPRDSLRVDRDPCDSVTEQRDCRLVLLEAVKKGRTNFSVDFDQDVIMDMGDMEVYEETVAAFENFVGDPGFELLSDAVQSAVETGTLQDFLDLCLYVENQMQGEQILECVFEKTIRDGKYDLVLTFCRHHEIVEDAAEQFKAFDARFRIAGRLAIQLGSWQFARDIVINRYPCIAWLSMLLHETYCLETADCWQHLVPILEEWLRKLPLSVLKDDIEKASDTARHQSTLKVLSQWCLNNSFPRLALVLALMQDDWPAVDLAVDNVDGDFLKRTMEAALRFALQQESWGTATFLLKHVSVDDDTVRRLLGAGSRLLSQPQRLMVECYRAGLHYWVMFLLNNHPGLQQADSVRSFVDESETEMSTTVGSFGATEPHYP